MNTRLNTFFTACLDILLGANREEVRLRQVTAEDLVRRFHPQNHDSIQTVSIFSYRDPLIRILIHSLKYHGRKASADLFAPHLYDMLVEMLSDEYLFGASDMPLLVPIPLFEKRLQERGYNQSTMLAQALSMQSAFPLSLDESLLVRIRDTGSQTAFSRAKRLKNTHGAFHAKYPDLVRGKTVILIDDVLTTGATIDEARKTLLEAGARDVYGIVVAH